ncbi:rCG42728 [Rattus norvegicus]|uniref:RCG42728 n=1 Tax=Rattus norvegicus TaxID=10116 RepID=A6K160_RAT|nr:rCG42728 [Rattus norvegicus]
MPLLSILRNFRSFDENQPCWNDCSWLRALAALAEDLGFRSVPTWNLLGSAQTPVTPDLGDPAPSSGFDGHCMQ